VPFFWSRHYDVSIHYVGHAESWDEVSIEGDPAARDCLVRYKHLGRVMAVSAVKRSIAGLEAEVQMELDAAA